jgi:hypothetical protein
MLPEARGRIPRIASACLGALCLAAIPIVAQTARQPFSASISIEPPASQIDPESYSVKAGSEVFVRVHLTNISRRKLAMGYDGDSRTGICFEHQYEVRDHNGKPAQKRPISHPEIGATSHGWPARILKPGESMDINGDYISRLYDLSQPGEYTIQLSRAASDNPKDGVVKSNTITVMVTP